MSDTVRESQRRALAKSLDEVVRDLRLGDTEATSPTPPAVLRRRRAVAPEDYSTLATLSLVDVDGVVRWSYEPAPCRTRRRRFRRSSTDAIDGSLITSIPIADLAPNRVVEQIENLDKKLTPHLGELRQWRDGGLQAPAAKIQGKRILLFVHGTFSKGDMFFDEIARTPAGKKYLEAAASTYDAILVFDHATLSVSPWINALDLDRQMARITGKVDVVCHSRGGLVVAWWLRMAPRNVQSVVFVGSPLAGTNFASPAMLRAGLDYLGNVMLALSAVGAAASVFVPFAGIVTGLATACAKVLSFGASTPLLDAGIAVVPGLAAQSRVQNNAEIRRLFASKWPSEGDYYAVTGNFLPDEVKEPVWKFWRRFTNMTGQALYYAADVIFPGKNDLVVDTDCMGGPPREASNAILPPIVNELRFKGAVKFVDDANVHHCNYFQQPRTINLFEKLL
jgi:pimeloyl-ACP methyl ester carboxylesterase